MLVRSDIVDIFLKAINGLPFASGEGPVTGRAPKQLGTIHDIDDTRHRNSGEKASRRIFISDWELRRLHKPAEKSVHVPQCAIISPLSRDWLEYEGIEVIFDETGK